ncbi:MAG: hypothetical protein FWB96_02005 [Defluviitaleaceae bacterium]|nr:hypothetical protein [Defluviitaleaceae bacterium]MCL2262016.1 hypothetical protein [Defluviitaleaceae bacterium]
MKKKLFCFALTIGLIVIASVTALASSYAIPQYLQICPNEGLYRIRQSKNDSSFFGIESYSASTDYLDAFIRDMAEIDALYLLENQFTRSIANGTNVYLVAFSPIEMSAFCEDILELFEMEYEDTVVELMAEYGFEPFRLVIQSTRFLNVRASLDNDGVVWLVSNLQERSGVFVSNISSTLDSTTHLPATRTHPNQSLDPLLTSGRVHFSFGHDNVNWFLGTLTLREQSTSTHNATVRVTAPFPRPINDVIVASVTEPCPGLMREILACAFGGEPFIAEFNPATGLILFYEMDGEVLDWYRYNQTEESFLHLVRENFVATNPISCRATGEQLLRNTTVYDYLTRNIYEYDMYGNVTVTSFDDRVRTIYTYDEYGNEIQVTMSEGEFIELREIAASERMVGYAQSKAVAIQPLSLNWPVWSGIHHAQPSSNPETGPPIGGRWFNSPSGLALFLDINLQQTIPNNVRLYAFFTNRLGTDTHIRRGFRSNTFAPIDWPRDPYQARMTATSPNMGGSIFISTELAFSL